MTKKLIFRLALSLLFVFLIVNVLAADSTSVFSVQRTDSFSNPYSSLMSGVAARGDSVGSLNGQQFYDVEFMIPPAGCQPAIVRSDLLEEQDVPVFCELVPVKLNPSVDINRIESMSITKKSDSAYVSGVGFHPARAAINVNGNSITNGDTGSVGYVVVVLKKQPNEKAMPDVVNLTLGANLQFGGTGSFAIGQSEFYIPVLTDDEFDNNYQSYSFFNGLGYLRVEDINNNANNAKISIYSADGTSLNGFRSLYSGTIEKGKTSGDIYLSTLSGGQGLRITLNDLTLPQTKARVVVNGQTFDVYNGEKFYNDKCSVKSITSLAEGTGTVNIICGTKTFSLVKKLNNVEINVDNSALQLTLGESFNVASEPGNPYYLVYANQLADNTQYTFIANISSVKFGALTDTGKKQIITSISKKIGDAVKKANNNVGQIKAITKSTLGIAGLDASGWDLNLIGANNLFSNNMDSGKITFSGVLSQDANINDNSINYFNKALDSYDSIASNYGGEINAGSFGISYGASSLWQEYKLADSLGQNQKKMQILSRISNLYPDSLSEGSSGQNALQIMNAQTGLLSNDGSSDYDSKSDIYVQLLSVDEPSTTDSSVELHYNLNGEAKSGIFHTGETIYRSDKGDKVVTLTSFSEKKATIGCSYIDKNQHSTDETPKDASVGQNLNLAGCGGFVTIDKINFKQVAKVQLTPIYQGRTSDSNFTFAIGIEKRLFAMNLTPQEANKKITDLNKEIDQYKNITESLGKVISAGKLACLGVSTALNLKTLLSGINGESTARTAVMNKWDKLCQTSDIQKAKGATSVDDCIAKYSTEIESDVTAMKTLMSNTNTEIETLKNDPANQVNGKADYNKVFASQIATFKANPGTIQATDSAGNVVNNIPDANGKTISQIIADMNVSRGDISQTEFNQLKQYIVMEGANSGFSDNEKKEAKLGVYALLSQVKGRQDEYKYGEDIIKNSGGLPVSFPVAKNTAHATYQPLIWSQLQDKYKFSAAKDVAIDNGASVAIVPSSKAPGDSALFLAVLSSSGANTMSMNKIYAIDTSGDSHTVRATIKTDNVPAGYVFDVYNEKTYKNTCKNCNYMKEFALEPYKGMPALLPFDCQNGWYVQAKQTLPGGFGLGGASSKTYLDSGALNSFYLCNVGSDGMMDGIEGDAQNCIQFDLSTGQSTSTIPGLSESQAKTIVNQAVNAVKNAQRLLVNNPTTIDVGSCKGLKVRNSEGDTGSKCTDFMSSSDCQKIFNVCDPFICPNSRCDLGGTFKVDDVIQSGIVGSTLLCLPNFIGFNKDTGVVVPVCLTGINAGIEGWTSVLESYRDCINESVTNNRTVGICDEINSVYVCDFFWRQIGPFVNALAKNAFLTLFGKGDKGGGEYAFVSDAWANAEKSMNFFQTSYAKDSKLSFGVGNLANTIVADVCKAPMSATYPNNLNSMLTPESPFQFYASYEEVPYTSATVPATSQYKVYFHIFAGNDQGHYYQVYLKNSPETVGYAGKDTSVVASGYVTQGQNADQTKDFIDVSGFKELCVRIDATDKCGFKSVTTDAAVNYLKDKAVQDQVSNPVTTEKGCISGTQSAGALLTPNIQQAAEEFTNPELYNQGITRVCSGQNPGLTTNPSRWSDVGYCDITGIRCWVDQNSVKKAISGTGVENDTLTTLDNMNIQTLLGKTGYLTSDEGLAAIKQIKNNAVYAALFNLQSTASHSDLGDYATTLANLNADVNNVTSKMTIANQKAELFFFKAVIYGKVAEILKKDSTPTVDTSSAATPVSATTSPLVTGSADEPQTYLAKMIYGEERSEGDIAMTAAGWVAINRIGAPKNDGSSGNFPTTLQEVITQQSQFKGYASIANLDLTSLDSASWQKSLSIANTIWNSYTSDSINQQYKDYLYFVNVDKNAGSTLAVKCKSQHNYGTGFKLLVISGNTKDLLLTTHYCGDVVPSSNTFSLGDVVDVLYKHLLINGQSSKYVLSLSNGHVIDVSPNNNYATIVALSNETTHLFWFSDTPAPADLVGLDKCSFINGDIRC